MTDTVEWCTVVWQVVGGTSTEASTGWATFGVATLTGAFGVFGIWIGQKNQARSQAKSVRAALLAEVAAICALLKTRGFVKDLRDRATDLKRSKSIAEKKMRAMEVATHGHINKIYQANLAHLGGLSKNEADLIVRFHYILEGVFADITPGGLLAVGTSNSSSFERAASLLEEVLGIGEKLCLRQKPCWRLRWPRGKNADTEAEIKAS